MSIEAIRVYCAPLEAVEHYNMSNSTVGVPVSSIVEIEDSSGEVGFGEVCMASPHYQPAHNDGIRADLAVLAPTLIGLDPTRHDAVGATMDGALLGAHEAKAAIDIACWDLTGKLVGRPVCDLLGGAVVDRVPTYHVIGIGDPEESARKAAELQGDGHVFLQLKAGGRAIELDIEAIRAVGQVLRPGTTLAVDTNRGWSTGQAIAVSKACAGVAMWMEQPCATEAELRQIKPNLEHPLIVDESTTDLAAVARLIVDGTADGFGLKISRLGGLTAMRAVRDLCASTSTPMSSDDAWGGDIIAAAGVHLGSTVQGRLNRGAWISYPYHQVHYDPDHGPRLVDGHVTLPSGGPGLGLRIDVGQFGDPIATYEGGR